MAKKKAAGGKPRYLKITQVRSGVGRPETHRKTLRALGLRHQASVVQPDNEAIRGMLFQVRHLVEVNELEGEAPSNARSRAGAREPVTGNAEGEESNV